MLIAISKGIGHWKFEKYALWIQSIDPMVKTVELSDLDPEEALRTLNSVDGIIFVGGNDIHPRYYGQPDVIDLCGPIDEKRDEREFAWLHHAMERGIPILGICRGMQLVNIALGGTLCTDIPTSHPHALIHKISSTEDANHAITLDAGSILQHIQVSRSGEVNSSHHQSIDRVGSGLRVIAKTSDGIVEAIEWENAKNRPFFLGVQWHPERMEIENPLSGDVGRAFIKAIQG